MSSGPAQPDDLDLVLVVMELEATEPDRVQAILARYVVLTRGQPGCRNVDLCLSATTPATFWVVQKWESIDHQKAHFDSPVMVEMATACRGHLQRPPRIDLLDAISAHDLH